MIGLQRAVIQAVAGLFLLVTFGLAQAQSPPPPPPSSATPPVGQQLVREGTLAVDLQRALGLGTEEDEAEAESSLAEAGITPRNGWIADYPVTPDIIGELYKSVRDSAASEKLSMGVADALQRLSAVLQEHNLSVKPSDTGKPAAQARPPAAAVPPPGDLQDYYVDEGPPIVTYYAPPPSYYTMYSWVPYPFWWGGFWFTGYYILNDFHRPLFINNRSFYISNHFRDIRNHRVFRVDPVQRFRGRTYSGIGARSRDGLSTGVRRSERAIFNRRLDRGPGAPSRVDSIQRRGAAPGGAVSRPPATGGAPGGTIRRSPGAVTPGAVQRPTVESAPGGATERSIHDGAAPGGRIESIPRGDGGGLGAPGGRGGGGFERGGGGMRGR